MLLDLNIPFDGINTCFSSPRSCFTHNANFVVLKVSGKKIPGMFEIYETGVRFVPLENYLARHFTAYAEVYELNSAPDKIGDKFNQEVLLKLKPENQLGYDFSAALIPATGELAPGETWAVCSSLTDMMFKTTVGIALQDSLETLDHIDAGALKNLDRLTGLPKGRYFTPTSIMRSDKMNFVGTVDNRNFVANTFRELVIGNSEVPQSVGDLLSRYDIDLKALDRNPAFAALKLAADMVIKKIAANPLASRTLSEKIKYAVGSILEKALGYQDRTFPRASAESLALAVFLQRLKIEPAVTRLTRNCADLLDTGSVPFILQEVEKQIRPAIWEQMEKQKLSAFFKPRISK